MNFKDKSVMVLATGFFAGYIPFAPGTFGSIVGLPISVYFNIYFFCHMDIEQS